MGVGCLRRVLFLRRAAALRAAFLCVLVLAGGILAPCLSGRLAHVLAELRREVPIYAVETKEKKAALSFDAAWGADYTPRLLEILARHGVKATFFLTGIWVEEYPEMVKKIAAAGHELGNHTTTHPHCASLSREELEKELSANEEMIRKLTGKRTRLFRPPYGEYNDAVVRTARDLGYEVIQWSVDSLDWQEIGPEAITDRVLGNIHPGAIVLFHNNARYTPEALPGIITALKKQGYELVPISELLLKGECYVEEHSGIQKRKKP